MWLARGSFQDKKCPGGGEASQTRCREELRPEIAVPRTLVVGGVCEENAELRPAVPAVEEAEGVGGHDFSRTVKARFGEVFTDGRAGLPVLLHEDCPGSPAAERLNPQRPRTSEKIEHPDADNMAPEDREKRLSDTVGGRPGDSFGYFERDTTRTPGNDTHEPLSEVRGWRVRTERGRRGSSVFLKVC